MPLVTLRTGDPEGSPITFNDRVPKGRRRYVTDRRARDCDELSAVALRPNVVKRYGSCSPAFATHQLIGPLLEVLASLLPVYLNRRIEVSALKIIMDAHYALSRNKLNST